MDVQSFVLCNRLRCDSDTNEYTLFNPSATFEPVHENWPLIVDPCFYLMLRRSAGESQGRFTLLFNLIDQDGNQMVSPKDWRVEGAFDEGQRIGIAAGQLLLEFPKRGPYRLDISVIEPLSQSLYSYDIYLE